MEVVPSLFCYPRRFHRFLMNLKKYRLEEPQWLWYTFISLQVSKKACRLDLLAGFLAPRAGAPTGSTAGFGRLYVQERSFFVGQINRPAGSAVRQTQGSRAALCRLNKSVE